MGLCLQTHVDTKLTQFCMLKRHIFASEFGIWKSDSVTKVFYLLDKSWGVRRWNYVILTFFNSIKTETRGRVCGASRCQFFNSAYLPDLCRNPGFLNHSEGVGAHWALSDSAHCRISTTFAPDCILSTSGSCIWCFTLWGPVPCAYLDASFCLRSSTSNVFIILMQLCTA